MKEAYLYKKLPNNKVQCKNCAHYCNIPEGNLGICGVRSNIKGKLYALNYGKAVACHIDPIEKKPFFHFLPNTYSLSVATVGCNLNCKNCQNWDISQNFKGINRVPGEDLSPKEIVKKAQKNKLPSISYTYTEPAVFSEYALETMDLARAKKIKNVWVTNGFWSEELFNEVWPYLDAANVDIKGFTEDFYQKICGARLKPILENLIRLKEKKVWIEITTLVIPTLNDSEATLKSIAKFIKEALGPETPWHVTQFSGAISWKLKDIPDTPFETLKRAWEIGRETGLKFVYTGNAPGLPSEDTFCPRCKTLCIDRTGYIVNRHDKNGKCQKCGEDLHLILK